MAFSDIAIRLAVKGSQKAKAELQSVTGGFGNFLKGGQPIGPMLAKMGPAMAAVAGAAVLMAGVKGLKAAVNAFADFDDKMTQSLAIMKTTEQQELAMARTAQQVSQITTLTSTQAAESYFFLASAGLDAEQSMAALPQVAKFAQAGMFDMARATDLATDAQSALGLTVKDSRQNLINLTRVTDVLVKANQLANASVEQFSEALTTKAGAALKVVNKDVEEGVAVLAAFADRGVKSAAAGDRLNQLLRDIPRATAKNGEAFKALNIEMFDSEGKMKNIADIIEILDGVLGPMSDEMKAATLDQLGLNRGVADAVKILSGASEQIRNYEHELRNAGGATEQVAQKQLESFNSQVKILKNLINNLAITIGEDLVPFLMKLVEQTQIVVNRIQDFRNRLNNVNAPLEVMGVKLKTIGKILMWTMAPSLGLVTTGLKKLFGWIGKGNAAYKEATDKANQLTDAYARQQYYLGFVASETEALEQSNLVLTDVLDGTNLTVAELNAIMNEHGFVMNEVAEEQYELARAYEDGLLGGLQGVIAAYDQLQAIQDRIDNAEKARNKALKDQYKAEEKVTEATENLDKARQDYAKVQGMGAKVTLEEELAIERQKQAIEELQQVEERSKIQNLELQLAKEQLTKLIQESTAVSQEEQRALENITRAEEELTRAEDLRTEAVDRVKEAQERLNKVTEKSARNLLEQALAQEQLTKALANFGEGTKGYEDAIQKIADITGEKLGVVDSLFENLFTKAEKLNNLGVPGLGGGGSGAGGGGGAGKYPTPTVQSSGIASVSDFNAGKTTGNNIVVNVGGALASSDEITEAVAEAMIRAQKQGIKVII
jgi:TP901 family phage tail tape measure protein